MTLVVSIVCQIIAKDDYQYQCAIAHIAALAYIYKYRWGGGGGDN